MDEKHLDLQVAISLGVLAPPVRHVYMTRFMAGFRFGPDEVIDEAIALHPESHEGHHRGLQLIDEWLAVDEASSSQTAPAKMEDIQTVSSGFVQSKFVIAKGVEGKDSQIASPEQSVTTEDSAKPLGAAQRQSAPPTPPDSTPFYSQDTDMGPLTPTKPQKMDQGDISPLSSYEEYDTPQRNSIATILPYTSDDISGIVHQSPLQKGVVESANTIVSKSQNDIAPETFASLTLEQENDAIQAVEEEQDRHKDLSSENDLAEIKKEEESMVDTSIYADQTNAADTPEHDNLEVNLPKPVAPRRKRKRSNAGDTEIVKRTTRAQTRQSTEFTPEATRQKTAHRVRIKREPRLDFAKHDPAVAFWSGMEQLGGAQRMTRSQHAALPPAKQRKPAKKKDE